MRKDQPIPDHSAYNKDNARALINYGNSQIIFNTIAGLPKRYRTDIWARERKSSLRYLAKLMFTFFNLLTDHPIKAVFGVWGTLVVTQVFMKWATEENIKNGGEGYGPAVTLISLLFALQSLAFGVVGVLSFSFVWSQIRGAKRPDYKPFKDFINQLKEKKAAFVPNTIRIITDPCTPDEYEACADWYKNFISALANGTVYKHDEPEGVQGLWEAIGYIVQDLRKHFPFDFEDYQVSTEVDEVDARKRRTRDLVMRETSTLTESSLLTKNYGLLAGVLGDPKIKTELLGDLYNSPLLKNGSGLLDEESEKVKPETQRFLDQFFTASLDEKRAAAKSDWRKMQTIPYRTRVSRRDIAMQVTSHAIQCLQKRTGLLAKEGGRAAQAKILKGLLKEVILHPYEMEIPGLNPSGFGSILVSRSFQLVNLLRPAIEDGQWHNWRYFYASDPVVTGAFKLLSPQQQAWMIFTLMCGNDHGKLLALSILQDERLQLTRFDSVNDRSYLTAIRDQYGDRCLLTFFETYIREFFNLPEERVREALKALHPKKEPSDEVIAEFRQMVNDEMRSQLLWLTENSTGRISKLFEKDAGVATKILWLFSLDLPDAKSLMKYPWVKSMVERFENQSYQSKQDWKKMTYKVASVSKKEKESESTRDDHTKHDLEDEEGEVDYYIEPRKQDGSFNFSLLKAELESDGILRDISRQQIVETLLSFVNSEILTIDVSNNDADESVADFRKYLSAGIVELLTRKELRHTVPKELYECVINQIKNKNRDEIDDLFYKFIPYIPKNSAESLDCLEQVLDYYQDEAKLLTYNKEKGKGFREDAVKKMTIQFSLRQDLDRERVDLSSVQEILEVICQSPEVIENYLVYGIGVNLPLDALTVAMCLYIIFGYQVEIYSQKGKATNKLKLWKQLKSEGTDLPVIRIFFDRYLDNWTYLRKTVSYQALLNSEVEEEVEEREESLQRNKKQDKGKKSWKEIKDEEEEASDNEIEDEGEYTSPQINTEQSNEIDQVDPIHPFIRQAQELFWSITDPDRQEAIRGEMEIGHPERAGKGVKGSTEPLFLCDMVTDHNINAIKRGVLQSRNLYPLHRLLISNDAAKRERAYYILARLLSDPTHGVDYHRIFRKFLKKYYIKLTIGEQDREIENFLRWLKKSSLKTTDQDMARARYVAAMIFESGLPEGNLRKSDNANVRSDRILKILELTYSGNDPMQVREKLSIAFSEKETEWESMRNIFMTVLSQIISSEDTIDPGLKGAQSLRKAFASLRLRKNNKHPSGEQSTEESSDDQDEDQILVPSDFKSKVMNAFQGDLFKDPKARRRMLAWGSMLVSIVRVAARSKDTLFLDALLNSFIPGEFKNENEIKPLLNVALVLLFALDVVPREEVSSGANLDEKMSDILSWLKSLVDFKKFNDVNRRLKYLDARLLKVYKKSKSTREHIRIESIYLRMATYLLEKETGNMKGELRVTDSDLSRSENLSESTYLLDASEKDNKDNNEVNSVDPKEQACALIVEVIKCKSAYKNITAVDRNVFGSKLVTIISSLSKYEIDSEYEIDRMGIRDIAARILFLFFYGIGYSSGASESQLCQYADSLWKLCEDKAVTKTTNRADGLKALIESLEENEFLKTVVNQSEEEISKVTNKMCMLMLYRILKNMPKTQYRLYDQTIADQSRFDNALKELQSIWELVENKESLQEAAKAMQVEQVFTKIKNLILRASKNKNTDEHEDEFNIDKKGSVQLETLELQ